MKFHLLNIKNKTFFVNLLFSFIPISFIAGNLLININIFLFIVTTFIFFGKDIIDIKPHFFDKVILFFFGYVILNGLYNNFYTYTTDQYREDFVIIAKSILFLRFLLLYLIVRFLIEKKLINLKYFFYSCTFFTLFVSLDIYYQFIFGQDVFGFENMGRKYSGPFGDELIAGSFIQRFSLFSFFLFPFFFTSFKKKLYKFSLPILFMIFFTAIVISGNRMPLILFIFSIFLILFFEVKFRKYFIVFLTAIVVIFSLLYNFNFKIKNNFERFKNDIIKISTFCDASKIKNESEKLPPHCEEFKSFYGTWKLSKYIGGGIKTFRYNCHKTNISKVVSVKCNTHPHNYYLEILTELGIVGFVILSIIFLTVIINSLYKNYLANVNFQNRDLITPFIFIFLCEVFPIKSTGSFFTTGNATFIFLIMSITIALMPKKT